MCVRDHTLNTLPFSLHTKYIFFRRPRRWTRNLSADVRSGFVRVPLSWLTSIECSPYRGDKRRRMRNSSKLDILYPNDVKIIYFSYSGDVDVPDHLLVLPAR